MCKWVNMLYILAEADFEFEFVGEAVLGGFHVGDRLQGQLVLDTERLVGEV
jgi:hypothetical protein